MSKKKPVLTFKDFFTELRSDNIIVSSTTVKKQPVSHPKERRNDPKRFSYQDEVPCSDSDSIANPFTDESSSDWIPGESDQSWDEDDSTTNKKRQAPECTSHSKQDKDMEVTQSGIPDDVSVAVSDTTSQIQDSHDSDSNISYEYSMLSNRTVQSSILTVAKRGSIKNIWDKHHACKFCKKTVTKMSSHLQRVHKNEIEVVQVMQMPKGSYERRKAWGELLNEGDFLHNYHVLESGSGELIPKYRSKAASVKKLVMCPLCKGLYNKELLYLHGRRCKKSETTQNSRHNYCRQGKLLMPIPKNVSQGLHEGVLMKMRDDDILRLIRNDSLILPFGERSYFKKDIDEHTGDQVSGRMRELGRLLKTVRLQSEMKVSTLTQILNPSNFDLLLKCVKKLAEFDEQSNQFKKGSLALRLGYSLKTCAMILQSEAIKTNDENVANQVQRFNAVFKGDWYSCISASALQSIHRARFNKTRLLPACSDIEKLHNLLTYKTMSGDYTILTKATLCSITLFNRKRGGEVQRMKIEDFEKGMTNNGKSSLSDPDVLQGLTETEKKMVDFFSRIEIRGKFSRKVPILLTREMIVSINVILEKRRDLTPPIDSPYLFASKSGNRPYRGSDVIRGFAKEANVANISIFTFTNMRKQVATLSQTLEITKWEQDQLAAFLGHDIRIHRNIYRQPVDILEKAKVAKILLSVNKGIQLPFDKRDKVDDTDEIEADAICSSDEDNDDDDIQQVPISTSELSSNISESSTVRSTSKASAKSTKTITEYSNDAATSSTAMQHPISQMDQPQKRKVFQRKVWSQDEKDAVQRRLLHCIVTGKVPQKDEVQKAISCEPVLRERTWTSIKDYVYNLIKKQKWSK